MKSNRKSVGIKYNSWDVIRSNDKGMKIDWRKQDTNMIQNENNVNSKYLRLLFCLHRHRE